jgi:hypothetical protein
MEEKPKAGSLDGSAIPFQKLSASLKESIKAVIFLQDKTAGMIYRWWPCTT